MRTATLRSQQTSAEGTFGEILTDSGFYCQSLELPDFDNAPDLSCVPGGSYLVRKSWSEKHQADLWHLLGVKDRTVIEVHAGNLAGAVLEGYASDLLGCIAPGRAMVNFKTGETIESHRLIRDQRGISESRATLKKLMADLGDEFELTIIRHKEA